MKNYKLRKIQVNQEDYSPSSKPGGFSAKQNTNYSNSATMKIQDYVISNHNQMMGEISAYKVNHKQAGHGDYSSGQSFVLPSL